MKKFAFCAALCLALAGAACKRRETTVEAGDREKVLHIGNGSEPRDLDPATAISTTESNLLMALFEGLVRYAPDARSVVPGAAQSWDISPDGRVYTFHLRPGLRWSNGDPLTAEDFQYSFRRVIEPKLGAESAVSADWVAGAKDYREGRITDLKGVGFRAVDPLTFEIRLNERTPFFLGILTMNPFFPVHRPTIEKHDAYLRRDGAWTRPGSLVGNGPFVLKDWRINEVIGATKNPFYWDAAHVALNAINFYPIDNEDTEERAYRGGALHVTRGLPAVKIAEYQKQNPSPLRADPIVGTRYMTFNVARPPFTDVRVRRALALAIDRKALTSDVLRDGSRPADCLTTPGSGDNYLPKAHLGYDPSAARALLAAAGFPGGAGMPDVTLVFTPSHAGEQSVAEAMQGMWAKELGVKVSLQAQEEKVWLDTLRTKNFQLLMDGWSSNINDPIDMFQLFLSDSPNNDANWKSATFDDEYAQANRSSTAAERDAHLQAEDAILVDELPMLPLYHHNNNYLVAPSVTGWTENLLGIHWYQPIALIPPGRGR